MSEKQKETKETTLMFMGVTLNNHYHTVYFDGFYIMCYSLVQNI